MRKLAAGAAAFLVCGILGLAAAYGISGIAYWLASDDSRAQRHFEVEPPWSWLIWGAWGAILLFGMPLLSKRFARAFGSAWSTQETAKDDEERWALLAGGMTLLMELVAWLPLILIGLLVWWILRATGCVGED